MNHLITTDELRKLGRPIGKVQDEKLEAFITEAEQLHIKPVIGDALFMRLLGDEASSNEDMRLLLQGGTYNDKRNEQKSFLGLKVALSYFVYAQNLMSGDFEPTRYGTVFKDGDYSSHISSKERSDAYNNALEVANAYLQESVSFAKDKGLIKASGKRKYAVGGITIKRIG